MTDLGLKKVPYVLFPLDKKHIFANAQQPFRKWPLRN